MRDALAGKYYRDDRREVQAERRQGASLGECEGCLFVCILRVLLSR